MIKQFWAKQVL